jgi:hypothetical protein
LGGVRRWDKDDREVEVRSSTRSRNGMSIRKTPSQPLSDRERDGDDGLGEADGPTKMENGVKGDKGDSLSAWGEEVGPTA